MEDVAVVIPWRAGCPHRQQALEWVLDRYQTQHPDWQIELADTCGPWCKGATVRAGVENVDAEVIVVADADVWCEGLTAAIDAVRAGAAWAIPHKLVHRLDVAATAAFYETGTPGPGRTQHPYSGHAGGGLVVLRRDTYLRIPIDPRFVGWGQEDDSWAMALQRITGRPWRGTADLIHLWHPPQPRLSRRWGSQDGRDLYERYRRIRTAEAMERLLAEIR
jgi:hypothetical protein